MIKEIAFKIDTGKKNYMMTWKLKQETSNLFQNNNTPERYIEKFLSNIQVAKQKECGIWLDDGTIISERKITKVSTITWETADSSDMEKARKFVTRLDQGNPESDSNRLYADVSVVGYSSLPFDILFSVSCRSPSYRHDE